MKTEQLLETFLKNQIENDGETDLYYMPRGIRTVVVDPNTNRSFGEPVLEVSTFKESGMMNKNKGLVVRIGSEVFNIQITRAR